MIMFALNDVVRVIRQDRSSHPRHGDPPVNSMAYDDSLHLSLGKINPPPFPHAVALEGQS
jgi:hypothetical protein